MWKVQRIHKKDEKEYVDYESEEQTFAQAWERGKQFTEDIEGLDGDLLVMMAPDGSRVVVAWVCEDRWIVS